MVLFDTIEMKTTQNRVTKCALEHNKKLAINFKLANHKLKLTVISSHLIYSFETIQYYY